MLDEGIVDPSIVTRWLKKFCLSFKNLDNQAMSGQPKTVDSVTIPNYRDKPKWLAFEEYQASSASHSPVWFINFNTLPKASEAKKLWLMLPKYS